MISTLKYAFLPWLGALGLSGCFFVSNDSPPSAPSGDLVVDFTIDGLKDPSLCSQSGVASIDVQVVRASGSFVGEYVGNCNDFATSIGLDPGDYAANAVLLDSSGVERTTAAPLGPFTILGNDSLTIPIDFPANSFL